MAAAAKNATGMHMPCLDGLRGLAALMVLFGHASDFGLPTFIDQQARDCGVLIFFALSGFLMGSLYLDTPSSLPRIVAYAVARTARIVPFFYLVVVLSYLYFQFDQKFVYPIHPKQLVRLLTFNGSASIFWSIAPEFQFYLVFVMLWVFRTFCRSSAIFVTLVVLLSLACLETISIWPGIFVSSKFHIFALGMLASLLRQTVEDKGEIIGVLHPAGLLALLIFNVPSLGHAILGQVNIDWKNDPSASLFYGNIPRVLIAVFTAFAFSFTNGFGTRLMASPVLVVAGRCSFSVYLLHEIVYDFLTRSEIIVQAAPWLRTLIVVFVSLTISAMTFRYVERPLQRLARYCLQSRTLKQGVVAAT